MDKSKHDTLELALADAMKLQGIKIDVLLEGYQKIMEEINKKDNLLVEKNKIVDIINNSINKFKMAQESFDERMEIIEECVRKNNNEEVSEN